MIRVLLVDDSPMIRRMYRRILLAERDFSVVGEAPDPFVARDLIVDLEPDVVLLDLEMPRMDGLTFLRRLMRHHPMPVVIASSLGVKGGAKALEAMQAGAVEIVSKPSYGHSKEEMAANLVAALRSAVSARQGAPRAGAVAPAPLQLRRPATRNLVAIGASTGGTVAIESVLRSLPADFPPIVITQHMPPSFTRAFAERLTRVTALRVREAQNGEPLLPGLALVAPGGKHLLLHSSGDGYQACVKDGPPVNGHRPSVDVLFGAVAQVAGADAIGILLTGMGGDGAKGLLEMHQAGARTFAQDEQSCAVFGMPSVAIGLGAADEVVPLRFIPHRLIATVEQ